MEIYLESSSQAEINEAAESMLCSGINARLASIRDLEDDSSRLANHISSLFPFTHLEALGELAHEITHEAHRMVHDGLDSELVVFRFPATFEGILACKKLTASGMQVHLELIGNLQQAWMAMEAGATWISIPIGSLQEQGLDPMAMAAECINMAELHGYNTRVMLVSLQHNEHIRRAIEIGAHAVSAPWKLIKSAAENSWSNNGARQLLDHSRMITLRVKDVLRSTNPTIRTNQTILEAVVEMSRGGMGAVAILEADGTIAGVFTDGDLRRQLETHGKDVLSIQLSALPLKRPITISSDAFLLEASKIFRERKIDNILVIENDQLAGMLDIQDLN
jgi:CBS domain-containing protein